MATTIYKFQSDLQGLKALNQGLQEAKANLAALKRGTQAYSTTSKSVGGMTTSLKKNTAAIQQTTAATRQLNASGSRMVGIFKSASIAIVSAFAFRAIIGGVRGVITTFKDFESQMAAVRAISGATDDEFKKLQASAIKLGSSTVFTATQVAKLQEEFARLGFSTKEILAAQNATLDLAAATGESLPKAAAIAGSSLRAFGLEAEQIQRVVNVMGASFTNSALNLERFTQSMKFVAPVGKAAGFTIEETTALLMNLADAGLHGSIAGNGLKNIFIKLGDANSKLNKRIGHSVQGMPQMIEALRGMKEESFDLTDAVELLDKRSAPAFLSLLENIDGLEANLNTLNGAEGIISQMAAIRLDTLEGDMTLLTSATEGLAVTVGESLNLSMRQSLFALTNWIKELNKGGVFVDRIKLALSLLRAVIIGVTARFIFLKTIAFGQWAIGVASSAGAVVRAFIAMRGSGAAASAAVFQMKFAMDSLKASIASTGIGVLVIALGYLIDKLFLTSRELGEVEMNMSRMQDAFEVDVKAIVELNEASQERHDLLRKLNTAYPELLGNIDLEIASNQELLSVLDVINKTRGIRMKMAESEDNIAKAQGQAAEDSLIHLSRIAEYEKEIKRISEEGQTYWENINYFGNSEGQINEIQKIINQLNNRVKAIVDNSETEIEAEQKNLLMYEEMIDKKTKSSKIFIKLSTENEKLYRLTLREGYLEDLEAFREMTFKKQEIEIDVMEAKLESLQIMKDLGELHFKQTDLMEEVGQDFSEENMEKIRAYRSEHTEYWEKLPDDVREAWHELILSTDLSQEALGKTFAENNVKISEMMILVANMKAQMKELGGGDGGNKVAKRLQGFRLNRTKEKLKELRKIELSHINDMFEHQMKSNEDSYNNKLEKYTKEGDLMRTNQRSIEGFMLKTREKQLIADIKANRNNYEVLKNMDNKTWTDLMNRKKNQVSDYMKVLQDMLDEEVDKESANAKIIKALKIQFDNDEAKIIEANAEREGRFRIESEELELQKQNTDLINLKSNQEERTDFLESKHAEELRHDTEMLRLKEMTQIEFDLREKQRAQDKADEEQVQRLEKLEKFKVLYSAMSDVIMAVSANISQRNMERIETEHEQRTEDLNNAFERDLELAEKNGGDTEAMQRTHDNKMEALEDIKSEKILVIKRRQFNLEKANNVAMALINGAQAIAKVTAQTGVGAIIAAPITAGLIASQLAVIMSQRFTGAKGGIIPGGDDKFAQGGLVHGPNHANGGVKFAVGGRVAELEGGEAVINKRSTAMFHGQLSAMNQAGGGKKFAVGGITPGTRAALDGAKGNWNVGDIAELISSSINSQQVYVSESEISSTQSSIGVTESLSTLFK